MSAKATIYRLAFTLTRAAVIGGHYARWQPFATTDRLRNTDERPMHRETERRTALPGTGGDGHEPAPLRAPRRRKPARRRPDGQ